MAFADGTAGNSIDSLLAENRRLRQALDELSILHDLARTISVSLNSDEIIRAIIRRSLSAVHAEQGVVTLVLEEKGEKLKTLIRTMDDSAEHPEYHLHQNILGWMHLNKKPLCVNSPGDDDCFLGIRWESSIRSLLCVPMMIKSELKGVLTVCNKKDGEGFTEDDTRLLAIIAAQSAQIVENARLYEEEKELISVRKEMQLASKIQIELLPKEFPKLHGYDIAAKSQPAREVGGDFFDFVPIEPHRLAFCIGDASGKGLPAAILTSNVQAMLWALSFMKLSARDCVARANQLVYQHTETDKFVTLFYGILDTANNTLTYSNAGHDNPLVLMEADVARLGKGGLMLGVSPRWAYEEEAFLLNRGALIVGYSDGVTEAKNRKDEEFGEKRLADILRRNRERSSEEIIDSIINEVRDFSDDLCQSDDITLVALKRL